MSLIDPETVGRYVESGWWGTDPLHRLVREQAARTPDADAYITPSARTSWATYDSVADDLAATLVALGIPVGDRVAVQLPDTFLVHAALVATARAGVVAVGIGARAGDREIAHLVRKTGARALVTLDALAGRSSSVLVRELRDLGCHWPSTSCCRTGVWRASSTSRAAPRFPFRRAGRTARTSTAAVSVPTT